MKIFFLIFVIFVVLMMMVHGHEVIHQKIYERFDIESEIHYDFLRMYAYTKVINNTEYYENCNRDCYNFQTLNEVIGYSLIDFYMGISLLILGYYAVNGGLE